MVHKVTSTRMKIDLNGAEGVETQRGIPVLREVLLSVFSSGKKEVLVSVETRFMVIALLSPAVFLYCRFFSNAFLSSIFNV